MLGLGDGWEPGVIGRGELDGAAVLTLTLILPPDPNGTCDGVVAQGATEK